MDKLLAESSGSRQRAEPLAPALVDKFRKDRNLVLTEIELTLHIRAFYHVKYPYAKRKLTKYEEKGFRPITFSYGNVYPRDGEKGHDRGK